MFPPRTDLGVKLLHISCHLHAELFSCSLWCTRHVCRHITRVLGRLTSQNFDSPTGRLRRQNPPKLQVQNLRSNTSASTADGPGTMPDAVAPSVKMCPSDDAGSPSSLPSSSAFDHGLLTVTGNLVQLTDAREFAQRQRQQQPGERREVAIVAVGPGGGEAERPRRDHAWQGACPALRRGDGMGIRVPASMQRGQKPDQWSITARDNDRGRDGESHRQVFSWLISCHNKPE